MRFVAILLLLSSSLLGSGCALVEDGTRDICLSISAPIHELRERSRNEEWAETAWQQINETEAAASYSEDFAVGFKNGYAEYLFRGGDGEPPLVAPLSYRHVSYQTPAGYAAISDWFMGYRRGAATARAGGARDWITGPSSLRLAKTSPPVEPMAAQPEKTPVPLPMPMPRKLSEAPRRPAAGLFASRRLERAAAGRPQRRPRRRLSINPACRGPRRRRPYCRRLGGQPAGVTGAGFTPTVWRAEGLATDAHR